MNKPIRIGTRNSPLAVWQAKSIARQIGAKGFESLIIPVLSPGDKNLVDPLYSMGITGIFTRDLDIALLKEEIDFAVHSLKDVPSILPEGIVISSVSERDHWGDVLIRSSTSKEKAVAELSIATSSLRRRAFWLNQFPGTRFSNIRGNLQTRLEKLERGIADATILSLAGIRRIGLETDYEELSFMLPAPGQGVVACTNLCENEEITEILRAINHRPTELCVSVERAFLNTLEGGCSAPIGALAECVGDKINFVGKLSSLDGENILAVDDCFDAKDSKVKARELAMRLLESGGTEIMREIRGLP